MLDVRDLTDHPGAASRVTAPNARRALEGLGFEILAHVELPMAPSTPLREVLVAEDGLVVSLQWSAQEKELLTLVSLLEDGTVLETDVLPGPALLRTLLKPGYPALGFRSTQGPAAPQDAVEHHRSFVSAQAEQRSSLPVPLRARRQVLAVLERKVRAEAGMLAGSLAGVAFGLAVAASYMYWLRRLGLQDNFAETMQSLTPPGVPVKLVVVAPLLLLMVASMLWPLVFARIPLGRTPSASQLLASPNSQSARLRSPPDSAAQSKPVRARWIVSTLQLGVPLPVPPLLLLGVVVSPLAMAVVQYAQPAGAAEDYARRMGADEKMFGDATEAVILLVLMVLAIALVSVRQRLEVQPEQVTFRPWNRGFMPRVHPRSALSAVWLRGPAAASRWGSWEVLLVFVGDELPLVVRADRRQNRQSAARVGAELANRLNVPFETGDGA